MPGGAVMDNILGSLPRPRILPVAPAHSSANHIWSHGYSVPLPSGSCTFSWLQPGASCLCVRFAILEQHCTVDIIGVCNGCLKKKLYIYICITCRGCVSWCSHLHIVCKGQCLQACSNIWTLIQTQFTQMFNVCYMCHNFVCCLLYIFIYTHI